MTEEKEYYVSSDSEDACLDHCINDAGHNCRLCERFEQTEFYKKEIDRVWI